MRKSFSSIIPKNVVDVQVKSNLTLKVQRIYHRATLCVFASNVRNTKILVSRSLLRIQSDLTSALVQCKSTSSSLRPKISLNRN